MPNIHLSLSASMKHQARYQVLSGRDGIIHRGLGSTLHCSVISRDPPQIRRGTRSSTRCRMAYATEVALLWLGRWTNFWGRCWAVRDGPRAFRSPAADERRPRRRLLERGRPIEVVRSNQHLIDIQTRGRNRSSQGVLRSNARDRECSGGACRPRRSEGATPRPAEHDTSILRR